MTGTSNVQYHHFVPQFLLKNFSHPYDPPKQPGQTSKRSKQKYKKGMYPGDSVIRHVDLTADPPVICEKPVKRILGKMDMYRDTSQPTPEQQELVEKMFSKLESEASVIFRKITKSFEQRDTGLWLTRVERNTVRKFLFLLKYRGSTFHHRFYHDSKEAYDSNDRELLHEYMQEKGHSRPVDVWFDNLKTIMNLDMDPENKWIDELPKKMFYLDAKWLIAHVQMSYMAICTPSEAKDEFVLTDNSYNIFEGPNTLVTDEATGKVEGAAYAPLHEFAPISPNLMIVLRRCIIPVPEEDANANTRRLRNQWRSAVFDDFYGEQVKSVLADLPITKAENSYSKIVNGYLWSLRDGHVKPMKDDKFLFKFFPIKTDHVHLINALLLENAQPCTSVVFESETSFYRTLEWYLTTSFPLGKVVSDDINDSRLVCLKKLAAILRDLGSKKEPVWKVVSFPKFPDFEKYQRHWTMRCKVSEMARKLDAEDYLDSPGMQIFRELGGNAQSLLLYDLEQARLMWKLRVKIDAWSQGVDELVRHRNRQLLIQAYLRLPARRVWLFVKQLRFEHDNLALKTKGRSDVPPLSRTFNDPEDIIARASRLIEPENLAQLMYNVALNDLARKKLPAPASWGPMATIIHWQALMRFIFERPGPICSCGIFEIELLAAMSLVEVTENRSWVGQWSHIPFINDTQAIELTIRKVVKSRFVEVLSGRAEKSLLKELRDVFFNVAYPIPYFGTS
ncbi:hypothetical protein QQZ08_004859 [Neonectria magnoliae]|uniref:DUF4238 domain-containing protein n=1 Tax=Neonectria magnoliae TaxID=2732573 RepID=A0ABR1I6U4_9HYPO